MTSQGSEDVHTLGAKAVDNVVALLIVADIRSLAKMEYSVYALM